MRKVLRRRESGRKGRHSLCGRARAQAIRLVARTTRTCICLAHPQYLNAVPPWIVASLGHLPGRSALGGGWARLVSLGAAEALAAMRNYEYSDAHFVLGCYGMRPRPPRSSNGCEPSRAAGGSLLRRKLTHRNPTGFFAVTVVRSDRCPGRTLDTAVNTCAIDS